MRVIKPLKVPILTRVVELAQQCHFHVAAVVAFPLDAPRSVLDEMAFWQVIAPELGASLFDEGVSKACAELLVAGKCHAPGGQPVAATHVRVRIGAIDKRLAVIGDRHWSANGMSNPEPFTEMPLDWSRAFGGPNHPPNPYGMGIEEVERGGRKVRPLPNVEPYGALMRSPDAKPTPAGLLPMDVTFAARRARAGTYGGDYARKHAPGFPPDLDPHFFNLGSSDQWQEAFWRGDEPFLVENMRAGQPRLEGTLPGLVTRAFVTHVADSSHQLREMALRCDTVWLFPSANTGAVVFHGAFVVAEDDAGDIGDLLVACEEAGQPRPLEHYQLSLARRLDKETAAIATISDSDLMPARESGVVANLTGADMMKWLQAERLTEANLRRGAARVRQARRDELIAEGIDPAQALPEEPDDDVVVPRADDFDGLAAFLETSEKRVKEQETHAEQIRAEAETRARAAYAEMGLDYDQEQERLAQEERPRGPPEFRAAAQYTQHAELAEACRKGGAPNLEIEALLADPQFFETLVRQEQGLLQAYRASAHLMAAAKPMTAEAAQMARVVVDLAKAAGEPLCERDFSGADLRGMDLRGMDFTRALLEGADLRETDLRGAILEGAVLARADLRAANLSDARLAGANLGKANLEGAVLDQADLTQATLSGVEVAGARLARARFGAADLMQIDWSGVDLSGASFDKCTFLDAKLVGTKLGGASLVEATLVGCTFDDADFTAAQLHKTTIVTSKGARVCFAGARVTETVASHQTELPEADFRDAILEKSCLRTTVLRGARFDRAALTMTDLSACDASGAVFDGAVMTGALLIRTKLDGASLRGANLTEALLSKSEIRGASFDGAQLCRADFSRAKGDAHTSFKDAAVEHTRFDKDGAR